MEDQSGAGAEKEKGIFIESDKYRSQTLNVILSPPIHLQDIITWQ